MEIRNLKTFLQVAAVQNFTKAADILGYSQSNVSARIRQLEDELGMPLFDRIGRRVTLTQYGELLVPYAQQVVSKAADIENLMKNKEELQGTIRAGIVQSLFECQFQDTYLAYRAQFPKIEVDVTVDETTNLIAQLRDSKLDFACIIGNPLAPTEWRSWYRAECEIVLAANAEHPLAGKPDLTLADFDGQEFILMEESAPYHQAFMQLMSEKNIAIQSHLRLQSPQAAAEMLSCGPFLSVLPDFTVRRYSREGKLAVLSPADFSLKQTVQLVVHKNKVITPQIEGFLEVTKAFFQKNED